MTIKEYIYGITQYIKSEYYSYGSNFSLTNEKQKVLNGLIINHYNTNDSICNAASSIVKFLQLTK